MGIAAWKLKQQGMVMDVTVQNLDGMVTGPELFAYLEGGLRTCNCDRNCMTDSSRIA